DAVLPFPSRFARKQVGRARKDLETGAVESARAAPAESKRGGRGEGKADHPIEHVAVAVPANAGAGIVAGEQHVNEILGRLSRDRRRILAQRQEPGGYRLRRRKARI